VNYGAGFTTAQICVNGISIFGLPGPSYCITVVNNAPNPGVITGNLLPCQSSTEAYYIQPVTNATSYTWTSTIVGTLVSSSGTGASISFPASAFNGNVCVSANTSCGITSPSCLTVNSDVPGNPGPISGPVTGLCNLSNVNYSLNTSNAISYSWTTPAGVSINGVSNLNAVNMNFSSGFSTGDIIVEAFYICGSSTSVITVSGLPQTPTVTPELICPGANEQYTASSYGATSYAWNIIGYDFSSCMDLPVCSQYFVTWGANAGSMNIVANNSCGSSASYSLSGVSCKNALENSLISIYPNPNQGDFNYEFSLENPATVELMLTDLSGKIIRVISKDLPAGNYESDDLSRGVALQKGIYLVRFREGDKPAVTSKVIVAGE
jgi:hypothetical protein